MEAFLSVEPTTRYDTIFLDTWDTLTAADLPRINGLRAAAIRHLAPGGRVLLWGYGWMVRLFEDACRQLLSVPPDQRQAWLEKFDQPEAAALLQPVLEHFKDVRSTFRPSPLRYEGRSASHVDSALKWCRAYIVSATAPGALG